MIDIDYKFVASILGYIVTAISLVTLQLPKKWQILICQGVGNLLCGIGTIMQIGINSASAICFLAVLQCGINLKHSIYDEHISNVEKILFTIAYLVCGFLGFRSLLDLMPIVGAIHFMCCVFCKKEQHMRFFSLANAISFLVYYAVIGSTMVFAQVVGLASILIALYRYRTKRTEGR